MKKKKVILWSICFIIVVYYLVINCIRYKNNDYNNVRIGIANVSESPIIVEIFLDNKKIMKDTLFQTPPEACYPYVVNVSPGSHSIKFIINGDIHETEIFVLFVRYLYIEYRVGLNPFLFEDSSTPFEVMGKAKQLSMKSKYIK